MNPCPTTCESPTACSSPRTSSSSSSRAPLDQVGKRSTPRTLAWSFASTCSDLRRCRSSSASGLWSGWESAWSTGFSPLLRHSIGASCTTAGKRGNSSRKHWLRRWRLLRRVAVPLNRAGGRSSAVWRTRGTAVRSSLGVGEATLARDESPVSVRVRRAARVSPELGRKGPLLQIRRRLVWCGVTPPSSPEQPPGDVRVGQPRRTLLRGRRGRTPGWRPAAPGGLV